MPKLVTETIGGESYEYLPLGEYIVSAAGICDGRPTFKYTGIEVAGILTMLAEGDTIDEIVEDYQGRIPREAILEAILIASRLFRKIRKHKSAAA